MIEKRVKESIQTALKKLGIHSIEPKVEYPADLSHGDFSSNVAMVASQEAKVNPKELAEKIVAELGAIEGIEKIEAVSPGFINFYLSRRYFVDVVKSIDDEWGEGQSLKGKKILVEYAQPNLFKPFHVGHLLNTAIGESLSRIAQFAGASVVNISYPSDISLGVAKAVWSILKNKKENELSINTMGEAYADGTKQYEDSKETKEEIDDINVALNSQKEGDVWNVYQKGRELNLNYFKTIAKRLGSEFAGMFFESESGVIGKQIVLDNTPGVFEKSEGAVIFKGEEYGLHTRVFITSKDLPVYESKDIGLLKLKFEKYNPDISIVVTDIEQKQYFEVIKKAATLINKTWGENSLYWQHGRLRFEGGKVSSRYGNVPLAEDLIDQVKSIVSKKQSRGDENVSEHVAIAALKYAFLRSSSGKNVIFDFEKSISVEGDSGPYLQYSYARAKSVLEKAGDVKKAPELTQELAPELIPEFERLLPRFPSVVERAAQEYEPHYVTTYLTELAGAFNSWYGQERIIDAEYEAYKLALTRAFALTMKNGLWLLGIEAPERM